MDNSWTEYNTLIIFVDSIGHRPQSCRKSKKTAHTQNRRRFPLPFPPGERERERGLPHTTSALSPQNLLTVRPTVRNISRPPSSSFCHSVRISYMEAPIERASLRYINHASMGSEESAVHIGYAVNTWIYRVHWIDLLEIIICKLMQFDLADTSHKLVLFCFVNFKSISTVLLLLFQLGVPVPGGGRDANFYWCQWMGELPRHPSASAPLFTCPPTIKAFMVMSVCETATMRLNDLWFTSRQFVGCIVLLPTRFVWNGCVTLQNLQNIQIT